MDKVVGFIGLGIMGAPMAAHLLDAGFDVVTFVRRSPPDDSLVRKGIRVVANATELASAATVIITIVPDTADVLLVMKGEGGVFAGNLTGKLVIDMSSIAQAETVELHETALRLGAAFLDAPVSGGEVGAKAATLSIMAGGDETAFQRAMPIFSAMGKNITYVGGPGAGQAAKIANQIIVALTIEAVGEALLFASKLGADPARVRQALMGGLASSRILELHGDRMISRTFSPGFRIRLHRKDLGLALQGAKARGISLPATALTHELMNSCIAHGLADLDHSALVQALERMSNHTVGEGQ